MEIKVTTLFRRHFKKLPRVVQRKVVVREKIFKQNPFDSRLDTHKLHGKQQEEWSYSVDYDYRVSFVFLGEKQILYTDVGTHDEIYT